MANVDKEKVGASILMIFDHLENWDGTQVTVTKPSAQRWKDPNYSPFDLGLTFIRFNLLTARHHLLAAGKLLIGDIQPLWGEDVLARASIEASATAHHLSSKWGDPKKFVTHTTIQRIWELTETRKLVAEATEQDAVEQREWAEKRADWLVEYGRTNGFWKSNHDSNNIAKRHNIVDRCRDMFVETPEMQGRPEVYYRYLSIAAHSNLSLTINKNTGVTRTPGVTHFRPTDIEVMTALSVAVFGLETANKVVSEMTETQLDTQPFDTFRTLTALVMSG